MQNETSKHSALHGISPSNLAPHDSGNSVEEVVKRMSEPEGLTHQENKVILSEIAPTKSGEGFRVGHED